MAIRILQTIAKDQGYVTELKEAPLAYLDGTMTGIPVLSGEPIEIKIFSGRLECTAVNIHTSEYSKRSLNKSLNEMFRQSGPQSLDALSSTRDLKDDSCFIWDELRPVELHPTKRPIVKNGAPISSHKDAEDDA